GRGGDDVEHGAGIALPRRFAARQVFTVHQSDQGKNARLAFYGGDGLPHGPDAGCKTVLLAARRGGAGKNARDFFDGDGRRPRRPAKPEDQGAGFARAKGGGDGGVVSFRRFVRRGQKRGGLSGTGQGVPR